MFSGAFCAGLIEATPRLVHGDFTLGRFPALFAPASLKPELLPGWSRTGLEFSGAFCAGLIEAG